MIRRNPMLAVAGFNPPEEENVHPMALRMRERYLDDMKAGHLDAAEYWRGQAAAYFTGNPHIHSRGPLWRDCWCGREYEFGVSGVDLCEVCLFDLSAVEEELGRKKQVARSKTQGRLKRRKSKKENPQDKKKKRPKVEKITVEEARRRGIKGIDKAAKRYKRFHGVDPRHVEIYYLPDGKPEQRMEHVHVALHRTLETPYVVPWKSNKKGSLWLHEHPGGEGAPLEVLDPETDTTRKIGGDYVIDDWWYS